MPGDMLFRLGVMATTSTSNAVGSRPLARCFAFKVMGVLEYIDDVGADEVLLTNEYHLNARGRLGPGAQTCTWQMSRTPNRFQAKRDESIPGTMQLGISSRRFMAVERFILVVSVRQSSL